MMYKGRLLLALFCCVLTSCFNGYNENASAHSGTPVATCGVSSTSTQNAPSIFKRKCSTCHHLTKDGTGPKLAGSLKRAPSEAWLRLYIRNTDSLLRVGDTAARAREYIKPTQALHQHTISKRDMDLLIDYIR